MKWSALIEGLQPTSVRHAQADGDPDVTALCYDSRQVVPGAVFVAIEGFSVDGHRFVPVAVEKGAAAVVCRVPVDVPDHVAVIQVSDPRSALAFLACRFYGFPADRLTLIGVTGTSGKTTVTYLLEKILESAGIPVGVIGTINYRYAGNVFSNPVTTPESADLQAIFRQMVDSGITHGIMEVSSHALELSRVAGCWFDVGIFTNLSHDHLDYHETLENYWQAKRKLFFRHLKPVASIRPVRSVVNNDDDHGNALLRQMEHAVCRTSAKGNGDVRPVHTVRDLNGIRGQIATPAGTIDIHTQLVGDFNLENILSAIGGALAIGIPPATIARGIDSATCVPGRLERIPDPDGRFVFVDYSHKPDALENAIRTLRRMTPGRLITVFGCGGNRDRAKRPVMGEIAARGSDLTVITSDNPRSEDPLTIIAAIETGVRQVCQHRWAQVAVNGGWTGPAYFIEPDRRSAIAVAVGAAQSGDTVLIAGKGHETYQILADQTLYFDDREVVRDVLTTLTGCDA